MEFKRGRYITFKNVEDFYNGLSWAIEEFDCEIEEYFICGKDKIKIINGVMTVGEMWIEPKNRDIENFRNIVNMMKYIKEHFYNVDFVSVNINLIN